MIMLNFISLSNNYCSMKTFINVVIFMICACEMSAQQVISQISEKGISINASFVKQNLIYSSTNFNVLSCTERIDTTLFGNVILNFANETPEEEFGFNVINIKIGQNQLLNVRQDDLWTYMFNGKCTRNHSRFTSDRYFIPVNINTRLSLVICCGWPYGGEMPLLTIIAITPDEAKVVYNRHAGITALEKSPFCMTIQTNIVEYNSDGTPMWDADIHRIYYDNGRFLYD